ncbi:hypothetical protein [Alphaproteobacteria bacterium endosymbiont of Tiliacea citrago]|uniref:hypothetical protein n=1 Tax=Alphaproteobacteria bacterium endosymbiont of Tiliacea citrago TaxID=3077944 RepID=UPI00313CB5DE
MIDAFLIFNIPYEFETENLDDLYYKKIKENVDLEAVNLAYQFLKDPIKKLFFLCEKHGETAIDKQIIKDVFNSKNTLKQELDEAINAAKKHDWKLCWYNLQKYQYLKKRTQ